MLHSQDHSHECCYICNSAMNPLLTIRSTCINNRLASHHGLAHACTEQLPFKDEEWDRRVEKLAATARPQDSDYATALANCATLSQASEMKLPWREGQTDVWKTINIRPRPRIARSSASCLRHRMPPIPTHLLAGPLQHLLRLTKHQTASRSRL